MVMVTAPSAEEAENIGRKLLDERLVACANILSSVNSVFWWEGKISQESEAMMIMKTRTSLFDLLVKRVKQLHSYEVPEIISVPIQNGSQEYLQWINSVTKEKEEIVIT